MAVLTVGSGKQYSKIADAVKASQAGDVIEVQAGTYSNDYFLVDHALTIKGVGGMVKLASSGDIPNGKGIIQTRSDVTIENFEISGAKVADHNGAGIRYLSGNLVVKNCYFHDNENGILGSASAGGTITIDNSEFARNGSGSGYTHGIYIGHIASVTVTDSYFHDTKVGHHIKSRADKTTVINNRLDDGSGGSSYSVDIPQGGVGLVKDNFIVQSSDPGNSKIIHFGGESGMYSNSSLRVENNTIVNYASSGTGVANATDGTATLIGNSFYKVPTMASGTWKDGGGNTTLSSAPTMDKSAPWVVSDTTPDPTPTPTEPTSTITGTSIGENLDGRDIEATLIGKGGNDTYIIDSAGDIVVEKLGEGVDRVKTYVDYKLTANVENLIMMGASDIDGGGNDIVNTLIGNGGANKLFGNGGNDTIDARAGNDVLVGGKGNDVLTGGYNADKFAYTSAADGTTFVSNGTGYGRGDKITDFTTGVDKIILSGDGFHLPANLTVGKDLVFLSTTTFNGTNAKATAITNDTPCVIVDKTGSVYVDSNGTDAGYTTLLTVQSGFTIKASDISVYYDLG